MLKGQNFPEAYPHEPIPRLPYEPFVEPTAP